MEIIFGMQINVKVSTSFVLSFLREVARHVQNTQNMNLVIILQYIRKKIATALCSIVMQNIQIF